MGIGREIEEELDIDREIRKKSIQRQIQNGSWVMRNGDQINIREMTDSHIRNCIKMLLGKGSWTADAWVQRFNEELNFRRYIRDIVSGELEG